MIGEALLDYLVDREIALLKKLGLLPEDTEPEPKQEPADQERVKGREGK